MKNLSILISIFFLVFTTHCKKDEKKIEYGTKIEVPNEIATIKDAIQIANSSDTILIHPGEYFEQDIIVDKAIYITSECTAISDSLIIKQTIINANRLARVFYISDVIDTVKINGLTITGGYTNLDYDNLNGGGIFITNSNLKITNLIISNNSASSYSSTGSGKGGGLYITESYVSLENSLIYDNYARRNGGAFACYNSKLKIHDSKIQNDTTSYMNTIYIHTSDLDFKNVLFKDNYSYCALGVFYSEIIIGNCTGVFENVSVVNDSVLFWPENQLEFINCNIPGI